MSEISNERLQTLNVGDRVESMFAINYPIRGKWVCQEIKNNVSKQMQGMGTLKKKLQGLNRVGFSKLWKVDGSLVLEFEVLNNI